MSNLKKAVQMLEGHSVCICRGETVVAADGRGIAPLISLVDSDYDFTDAAAADLIVGKAAALLFVKCGVTAVFGKVMSEAALRVLKINGITAEYETLTDRIINRQGTDICPMEKAVSETDDPFEAYNILHNKINS